MKTKLTFEFKTCGRCGGSGQHSYCQRYGTMCFGCGGRGVKLTKRGEAAQQLYTRLASKLAKDVKVGDFIWYSNPLTGAAGWSEVVSIKRDEFGSNIDNVSNGQYSRLDAIVLESKKITNHTSASTLVRVRQSVKQHAGILDVCMQYQRSLGKDGKVSKSLAKIMREVAY